MASGSGVADFDASARLGRLVNRFDRLHVGHAVAAVGFRPGVGQHAVGEVVELLGDLVDVRAGSGDLLVTDFEGESGTNLGVERGIQGGLPLGPDDSQAVVGLRPIARGAGGGLALGELQLERDVFVYLLELGVGRAGRGLRRHRIRAEEKPDCVQRVDAHVHQRAAAREVRVESPLVRPALVEDVAREPAVEGHRVAQHAVPNQSPEPTHRGFDLRPVADHQGHAGLVADPDHLARSLRTRFDWLLAEDVLAVVGGGPGVV